ncbi:MAG TPA: hypothetical protein VHM70_10470 [Polyangiaceae bacterium]|nr:hypothetical protein [Polyangiaceae bacterium]
MTKQEIMRLGAAEQNVLGLSLRPGLSDKRIRNILISGSLCLLGVAVVSLVGVGIGAITSIALAIIVISVAEKISYSREILVYKSLVRNLVQRVDELDKPDAGVLREHASASDVSGR